MLVTNLAHPWKKIYCYLPHASVLAEEGPVLPQGDTETRVPVRIGLPGGIFAVVCLDILGVKRARAVCLAHSSGYWEAEHCFQGFLGFIYNVTDLGGSSQGLMWAFVYCGCLNIKLISIQIMAAREERQYIN